MNGGIRGAHRRIRPGIGALVAAALAFTCAGWASSAAGATSGPAGIPIPGSGAVSFPDDGGDAASDQITMYVDASGTAHVAYLVADGNTDTYTVNLCTIPEGATTCGDPTVLATDANADGPSWGNDTTDQSGDPQISSLKYLPGPGDTADLAVFMQQLGPASPPFDPAEIAPYSETEIFAAGSTTGIAAGDTALNGAEAGDAIIDADGDGIEAVGDDEAYDNAVTDFGTNFSAMPGDAFQFESLIGGASDSSPVYLPQTETPGTDEYPFEVTELPAGQVAVLVYALPASGTTGGAYPVAMRVQPADGGTFGPPQSLGISGAVATVSQPSQPSYVFDVEDSEQGKDLLGITAGTHTDPMELYQFRGTSLRTVASLGTAADDDYPQGWQSIPPIAEDDAGNFYVAWLAGGNDDGCPVTVEDSSEPDPRQSSCLMYRRVGNGGVLGPKLVLSAELDSDGDSSGKAASSDAAPINHLGALAVNAHGVGYLLVQRGQVDGGRPGEIEAVPLPASASFSTPQVSGARASTAVTCAGATGQSCQITLALERGSAALTPHASPSTQNQTQTQTPVILGQTGATVKVGPKHRLTVTLGRSALKALRTRRGHRLAATLVISQTVAGSSTATTLLSRHIQLR